MKKIFTIALGAALMIGAASCSKENDNLVNTPSVSDVETANAIKANQANNFAGTEWISSVDTTMDLSAFIPMMDSTNSFGLPISVDFRLNFNDDGDALQLSINSDSTDVVFVQFAGESTTIDFDFNYDLTTNLGTMEGTVYEITEGDPVEIVLNFSYNATDNTMLVNMPVQAEDPNDAFATLFLSFFQNLVFSLVE
ncbi:MAG: hypothetical protein IJR26_11040 [Bacteroidales bacterium]|nr:hypothetical protein [Bacteroidales bacterium]